MKWLTEPYSDQFKRSQRLFTPAWDDACALVGLVEVIGINAARWIFGWKQPQIDQYKALREHVGNDFPNYRPYVDGLHVLKAMQNGGWKRGKLPKVVRDVLREMHHRGMTYGQIGRVVGMRDDAVQWACRTPRVRPVQNAAAFGALAL